MKDIKMTIEELETLLNQQKILVIERLLSSTSYFNTESTEGHLKSIQNIDKAKFAEIGMSSRQPDDLKVLKRYLTD